MLNLLLTFTLYNPAFKYRPRAAPRAPSDRQVSDLDPSGWIICGFSKPPPWIICTLAGNIGEVSFSTLVLIIKVVPLAMLNTGRGKRPPFARRRAFLSTSAKFYLPLVRLIFESAIVRMEFDY